MFIVLSFFVNRLQKYNFSRNYANFLKEKLRLCQIIVTFLLIHLEQWVLRHHHDRFLFEVFQQLLADVFLVDYQAEHILTEPGCRHDETALPTP